MKSMRKKTFLKTNISIWNNTEFTDKNIIKNISMYLKAFKFLIYLIYNKVVIYVVWIVWRIFRGWESKNLLKSLNLFKSQKILKIFINHQISNERKNFHLTHFGTRGTLSYANFYWFTYIINVFIRRRYSVYR